MADMGEGGGGHEKGGKKRAKKGSTRVDMTPLVDLAFLLLTFFVLTSTFSKPKVMSLVYPAKPKITDPTVDGPKINNAITFLLSENKIFYYEGEYYSIGNPKGKPATELKETTFGPSGVRKLLADKNKSVLIGKAKLKAELDSKKIQDHEYIEGIKDLVDLCPKKSYNCTDICFYDDENKFYSPIELKIKSVEDTKHNIHYSLYIFFAFPYQ